MSHSSNLQPVFRSDSPNAFDWLEGAVMAVYFSAQDFPGVAHRDADRVNRAEFFDSEGWPVELPAHLKASLPEGMKEEFQIFPLPWRTWSAGRWQIAHEDPGWFSGIRAQASLVHTLLSRLPAPSTK